MDSLNHSHPYRFIFIQQLPVHRQGKYAHYFHKQNLASGWESVDIQGYLASHQEDWSRQLEQWHSQLSLAALKRTKWWWLYPASRLILWSPPVLKPFFFCIALLKICEEKSCREIYLIDCPKEVYIYLKELMPEALVLGVEDVNSHYSFKDFLRKRIFRNIKGLFIFLLDCFSRKSCLKKLNQFRLIVFSFMMNNQSFHQHGDHYFGKTFDHCSSLSSNEIGWVYFCDSKRSECVVKQNWKGSYQNLFFLRDGCNLTDFFSMIKILLDLEAFVKEFKKELMPLEIAGLKSFKISESFYDELIKDISIVAELRVYFMFKRLFKENIGTTIVYPYEEKGVERALLMAAQNGIRSIKTFGFAHAIYNKGLLYLRNRKENKVNPPRPDKILVTGPALQDWFKQWAGIQQEQMDVWGSPRHVDALLLPQDWESSRHLRVLIIISQGYEAIRLANQIELENDLFEGCDVLIRPYPYAWHVEQERGFSEIRRILPNIRIENGSLKDQIQWCDVAIYGCTSASLEVMLQGRLAIYFELNHIFNLDPFEGKGDLSQIIRCLTAKNLKQELHRIRHMSANEYAVHIKKQSIFARNIYAPIAVEKQSNSYCNLLK